jgi:hypothetical protein
MSTIFFQYSIVVQYFNSVINIKLYKMKVNIYLNQVHTTFKIIMYNRNNII